MCVGVDEEGTHSGCIVTCVVMSAESIGNLLASIGYFCTHDLHKFSGPQNKTRRQKCEKDTYREEAKWGY